MDQQITFRSTWFKDVATDSVRGEISGFDREWPGRRVEEKFWGGGRQLGASDWGQLGFFVYTVTAALTPFAFASIIIAWLKSKRRRIHLQNGTMSIEYEGPDPKKDLETIKAEIQRLVEGAQHPTINVSATDLGEPTRSGPAAVRAHETEAAEENAMARKPKREHVFVSYSHKDQRWRDELQTMLAPFVQAGSMKVWDDTQIKPGAIWRNEIEKALKGAKVAVLLVTANFLASDFITKNELPPLLEAAQNEGVTIFWIYFGSCNYEVTRIAEFQAAHDPSQALDRKSFEERQAILSEICAKLDHLIGA
jgi:hypothetical protein